MYHIKIKETNDVFSREEYNNMSSGVYLPDNPSKAFLDAYGLELIENVTNREAEFRAKRELALAETDFYALSDVTMTPEMEAYRKALRDITAHANWPNLEEADWPVKP